MSDTRIPSELEILLLPLPEHLHPAMTRVFYEQFEGDPSGAQVQSAMLLSGLVYAAKSNGAHPAGSHHAEDIEAARAEITQLAQIIRGVGESTSKIERRWSIVGDALTKTEQSVTNLEGRLKTLDDNVSVFRDVAKHHLLWLCGAAFLAGTLFWPFADILRGFLRGLFHF